MRAFVAAALMVGLVFATANCGDEASADGLASLGQYRLCQTKVVDTCAEEATGCYSLTFDDSRLLHLARRSADGAVFLRRDGAAPFEAQHEGNRFVLRLPEVEIDTVCGCRMVARESIRGEIATAFAPGCEGEAADGGVCLDDETPDAGTDDEFLAGADPAPLDPSLVYRSVRGQAVTALEPVDETCRCGPCRIEYDFTGRR